ncbi:hypothetical protein GCM10011376_02550 [Nocardioides flavus (ex Wang et al. 2016)]|uniref:Uncharacterized protein n=1 Tax=Nocardioides flavus (ex Wang et al. 2016) TaxID=2058780 RepID=A0ABQ3HID6_9ACTN|nr:hypothetical protein [Nocardioides flavus (ex Wang et al. 2016)]GHE15247.1 hypothetical protein GCM10011376_02550 [Nocardioides flavus (ex Wang et al. 2016)]
MPQFTIATHTPGFHPDGSINPAHLRTDPDSAFFWSGRTDNVGGAEVAGRLGEDLRPGNVWEPRELDALKDNPEVTRIVRVDPRTGETEVLWER